MTLWQIAYLIFFIFLLSLGVASISMAPWVPTRKRDFKRILKLADPKKGETFYELGCGTGKLAFFIAKNSPAKVIGLEISIPLYLISKTKQFFYKGKNIKIKYKNLRKENLAKADIIYLFGTPAGIKRGFLEKLKKETREGAKIISYVFPIKQLKPTKIDKPNEKELSVYLYEMK